MADFPLGPRSKGRSGQPTGQLPDGLIAHMIDLIESADSAGFPAFQAKLVDATEALIEERNAKGIGPQQRAAAEPQRASNVVAFVAAPRPAGPGAPPRGPRRPFRHHTRGPS